MVMTGTRHRGNSIVRHLIMATAIAALILPAAADAAHKPPPPPDELADPIFDIGYNPGLVHYPVMPARIRQVCKNFNDPYNWVFAHVKKYGADYYIVMSWNPNQDSDSLGAAVRIAGNACEEDAASNMFTGFVPKGGYIAEKSVLPPRLPGVGAPWIRNDGDTQGNYHYEFRSAAEEEVFRDLIRDGEAQGERVWGAARFKAEACQPENSKDDLDKFVPVYMEELRRYCRAH